MTDIAAVEFVTSNPIGDTYVELGFKPSVCVLFADWTVAAKVSWWLNNARFPNFPITNILSTPGGAGVNAVDANTLISVYAGGDTVVADETANTAGKHIDRTGAPSKAGHVTSEGVLIKGAALTATAGGRNILIALRNDV